ncbi:MAG: M23 family metallopeptidase [Myxococcales bacterium]|nr:M23 family metallopeptidase [Myxococcales bacterium]
MKPSTLAVAMILGLGALSGASRAQPLAVAPSAPPPAASNAAALSEVERLNASLDQVTQELAALTPRREGLRARARTETRWLYHMVQGDALAARGGPQELLEHAARAQRMRRVLENTLKALGETGRRGETLSLERRRLEGLVEAAQAHRARVNAEQLASAGGDPNAAPVADGPSVTVYGGAPGAAGDSFAASAGRLLFPIAGRAEVRRAWREGAEGPGVEVSSPVGTAVRASFAGRVAFADRYGAYGQIVIVDHGDHYYTVSANLGRIDVGVGQELAQGEALGTVGDEGRGGMLYFEVRRGSQTIDPVPWLGL